MMRARGWRAIGAGVGATAALMGAGLMPVGAKEKVDSFAGDCSVQGTNKFSPPATNTQQPLTISYDGSGTCNGTLNGRKVSNAPVKMHNTGHSNGSCLHAETTGPGRGTMTFADGTTIRFSFEFTFVFSEGDISYRGQRSGSGHGHGTFLTQRTPPDTTAKCAGQGVSELPLDITLTTDSPLVSGGGGDNNRAHPAPGGPGSRKRLRLGVRPRSVRASQRATFAFRVVNRQGRAVSGATVRFAGRRARTGRRGGARIAITLRRPGRRAVRATKPGFRAARATIHVRRR